MGKGIAKVPSKNVDLVFEGGGIKAIALVGALSVLVEEGYTPQNMAGTSAGAIVAALYAAGYTPHELRTLIGEETFKDFFDQAWEDRIPLIGKVLSAFKDFGLYEGKRLYERLKDLLAQRGVVTFRDLRHPLFYKDENPYFRYRMYAIAADLTTRRMLVLPTDAPHLGMDPDDLEVALAVRMSASIPLIFEPVKYRNPKTHNEHIVVDGGLLSNYPVWLFDVKGEPPWPTFGLRLVEEDPRRPALPNRDAEHRPVENLGEYFGALIQTMLEAHDRLYIENADFVRTIPIPTLGISALQFHLSEEEREALFQAGRQAAREFLQTWDFEAYKRTFRKKGEVLSRREMLWQAIQGGQRASAAKGATPREV